MSCFIENCAFKKYSDTFTNDKKEMANALNIDQQSNQERKSMTRSNWTSPQAPVPAMKQSQSDC